MRKITSVAAAACVLLASAVVQVTTAGPAAAIPGLLTVSVTSGTRSFSAETLDATCPSDRLVLGGGASIGGNSSTKVFLTESYPLDNGQAWRVTAAEVAPGWDGNWNVTAYAICARPLRGWEIKKGNSGGGASTFKTTFTFGCSEHKKVFSAGGVVNASNGQVGLTMVRPDGPLTIGRASARVAPGGFWDPWSVSSYAICAYPVPNQQNIGSIDKGSAAFEECPGITKANGIGGGGGTVDLGPYYLQEIAPNRAGNGVSVGMTGIQDGGTMAQVTCSD
jgi:hypothetical protein